MQARNNNSTIFRISEQTTVTHGEWALLDIQINLENMTGSNCYQSKLVYKV